MTTASLATAQPSAYFGSSFICCQRCPGSSPRRDRVVSTWLSLKSDQNTYSPASLGPFSPPEKRRVIVSPSSTGTSLSAILFVRPTTPPPEPRCTSSFVRFFVAHPRTTEGEVVRKGNKRSSRQGALVEASVPYARTSPRGHLTECRRGSSPCTRWSVASTGPPAAWLRCPRDPAAGLPRIAHAHAPPRRAPARVVTTRPLREEVVAFPAMRLRRPSGGRLAGVRVGPPCLIAVAPGRSAVAALPSRSG